MFGLYPFEHLLVHSTSQLDQGQVAVHQASGPVPLLTTCGTGTRNAWVPHSASTSDQELRHLRLQIQERAGMHRFREMVWGNWSPWHRDGGMEERME